MSIILSSCVDSYTLDYKFKQVVCFISMNGYFSSFVIQDKFKTNKFEVSWLVCLFELLTLTLPIMHAIMRT